MHRENRADTGKRCLPFPRNQENRPGRWITLAAVILWALLIWRMSAAGDQESSQMSRWVCRGIIRIYQALFSKELTMAEIMRVIGSIETPVRKAAHFTEYAVLGALMLSHVRFLKDIPVAAGVAACILYACTDEIHQYFVPGRACRFFDVVIDSAGILAGTALAMLIISRFINMRSRSCESGD